MDWESIIVQVPGMAMMVFLVAMFLKNIRAMQKQLAQILKETVEALNRNTEQHGRIELRLEELTDLERERVRQCETPASE